MASTKTTKTKTAKVTKTVKKAPKATSVAATVSASAKTDEKPSGLSVHVVGIDGKSSGRMTVPAELFGVKVNKALLSQAVRVYLANQRVGTASTKTRGEVEGSTRKIYKQKGTGRARHGGIRAPIFVGGGIVFGPKPRDYALGFSKSMKRAALASALSQKFADNEIIVVDGYDGLNKTKHVAKALSAAEAGSNVLLAVSNDAEVLVRSARNIAEVDVIRASDLHPYTILTHKKLVMTKKALDEAKKLFLS